MNASDRRGFTLIELLVVIAIIAILAAILFPVFARARAKARQTTCLSNMKQIGLAILSYVQDYDEKMPLSGLRGTGASTGLVSWDGRAVMDYYGWRYAIQPYIKNTGITICPDYGREDEPLWVPGWQVGWDWYARIRRSYAGCHSWAHPGYANPSRKLAEIPRPASLIMVLESDFEYVDMGTWTMDGWRSWYDGSLGPYGHHGGMSDWLFFDGHVKAIKPCATFGALQWNDGDVPADDFLWEWWTGVQSTVLRPWQANCYQTPEYR